MGALSGDSEIEIIAGSILVGLSLVSLILGCIALYIIHLLSRWNGYVLLIYAVTFSQIIYDFSYFFLVNYDEPYCYAIYAFLNSTGGIAVTLWINTISFLVVYTVTQLKTIDIKSNFYRLLAAIFSISVTVAILDVTFYYRFDTINWLYFWIRLGSIILNIIAYCIVSFLLQPCLPNTLAHCFTSQKKTAQRRKTNDLLIVLTNRLKYYPMVQVVTRAAAAWWDVVYGFSPNSWNGNYTIEKQVSQYLYDITNPFAGIGFFVVFLAVQPSAYRQFLVLCRKMDNCCKGMFCCSHQLRIDSQLSTNRSFDQSLLKKSLIVGDSFTPGSVFSPFRHSSSYRGSSVEMMSGGDTESVSRFPYITSDDHNVSSSSSSGYLDLDEDIVWDEIRRRILGSESTTEQKECAQESNHVGID